MTRQPRAVHIAWDYGTLNDTFGQTTKTTKTLCNRRVKQEYAVNNARNGATCRECIQADRKNQEISVKLQLLLAGDYEEKQLT